MATGDALFGRDDLWSRIDHEMSEVLNESEYVFTNAEFVVASRETPVMPAGYTLGANDAAVHALAAVGVTIASLAHNHIGDYGPAGVVQTLDAFEASPIVAAGIGRSLAAAREAVFYEGQDGRLGVVACCTTWAEEYAASDGGRHNAPRPGLNPLRWKLSYEVTPEQFDALRALDEALGTAPAHRETLRIERKFAGDDSTFTFGPLAGGLTVHKGDRARLRWQADEQDLAEICRSIRDAARRAEAVVASIHTHEGEDDGWYTDLPARFIIDSAHAMIEAGAHAVLCHGGHLMRGVEFHQGRPIFYGLHSLFFDLESGARIPEEMFTRYGLPANAYPSDLHGMRRRDEDGTPVGFYSDARFEQSMVVLLDIDPVTGAVAVEATPILLNMNAALPSHRGMPTIAKGDDAVAVRDALARLSAPFGTTVGWDAERGRLTFTG
ncbi:MAG: CapA family protein [Propioniciclava sp.]|uniref:CapA family protein n=1 Tax=Propioniciclava sp. TaxID=2038686 RepID=UPI0039E64E3A